MKTSKCKKWIIVVLTAIMCVCSATFAACGKKNGEQESEGELQYAMTNSGKSYMVTGIGSVKSDDVVIPSEYNNLPVTSIESGAFHHCGMASIVIPDSVQYIERAAFVGCNKLKSITVPFVGYSAGDQSKNFLAYIFGASKVSDASVVVPKSIKSITVTGNGKIITDAFAGFEGVTKLVISEYAEVSEYALGSFDGLVEFTGNASLLKYMKQSELTTVTVTDGVLQQECFDECPKLTAVNVTGKATVSDYAYAGSVFANCRETLSEANIGGKVTKLPGSLFYGCKNLLKVDLSDDIESMGAMVFEQCESLESIVLPSKLTNIGNEAFGGCKKLNEVTFGKSVVSIGERAFSHCSVEKLNYGGSLTDWLNISFNNPAFDKYNLYIDGNIVADLTIPQSVETIPDYVFADCESIKTVTLPSDVTGIGKYSFSGCDSLERITLGDNVADIGMCAFYACNGLTSVTLPQSVTAIDSDAFGYCYKLVEVYNLSALDITVGSADNGCVGYYALDIYTSLSDASKLTATQDGYVFYQSGDTCYLVNYTGKAGELVLPDKFNGKNYAIRKRAFFECTGLTGITIPDCVTAIEENAFGYCNNLSAVTIPDSVTAIGEYAFVGCGGLKSVKISANVTAIENSTFNGCSGLTSITIPDGVTTIGDYAFNGCDGLKEVTIADSVTSIGSGAFEDSTQITKVTCPATAIGRFSQKSLREVNITSGDKIGYGAFEFFGSVLTSVTIADSIKSIESYAFEYCGDLTSITLGNGLESISVYAFGSCGRLKRIDYNGTVDEWQAIDKDYDWDSNTGNYTVYCTDGEITKDGDITMY